MAGCALLVVIQLLCSCLGTPLMQDDSEVHQLPSEVVQQLLTSASSTLQELQHIKTLLQPSAVHYNQSPAFTLPGSSPNVVSTQLLLLLLNKQEAEQKRFSDDLKLMSEQVVTLSEGRTCLQQQQQLQKDLGKIKHEEVSKDEGQLPEAQHDMGLVEHVREEEQLQTELSQLREELHHVTQEVRQLREEMGQVQQEVGQLKQQRNGAAGGTGSNNQSDRVKNSVCTTDNNRPHDCHALLQLGYNTSGVYDIYPHRCYSEVGVRAWCDMEDGGWTAIVTRMPQDNQIVFNRGWAEYRQGFGDPRTEYWIGNEALHQITSARPQVLRVEMEDWDGGRAWAEYRSFFVEDEDSQYRLHLGQFSGDAGDSLAYHDNMFFSTHDRDNDRNGGQCAVSHKGGFWYNSCHYTSPTGPLLPKQTSSAGVTWYKWNNSYKTLQRITYKIKPKSCSL